MAEKVKPPKGLGNSGRALWCQITRALSDGWAFDERELAILKLACRQADNVAALETVIARDGVMSHGSAGQPVCHPAVGEIRQGRIVLSKMLGLLSIPDEEEKPRTAAGRRDQHAADTRWALESRRQARQAAANG